LKQQPGDSGEPGMLLGTLAADLSAQPW